MEYEEIHEYNFSKYNTHNIPQTPKKETSKLIGIVGGITLTALAILPLAGCIESSYYPSRTHYSQRRHYSSPRRHIHYQGCGHAGYRTHQRRPHDDYGRHNSYRNRRHRR